MKKFEVVRKRPTKGTFEDMNETDISSIYAGQRVLCDAGHIVRIM